MAGGVALNCVANGKIIKEKVFKDVWFQPAPVMLEVVWVRPSVLVYSKRQP